MRLDFSRPYAEVIGRPGIAFEQDGHNFRVDGSLVDETPMVAAAVPTVTPPAPPPRVVPRAQHTKQKLSASTALRHQFGDDTDMVESVIAYTSPRDVLAAYRDPQAPDGSMVMPAKAWTDGV
jgi:hypothetical protein